MQHNPFTPRFGSIPAQMAGRSELIEALVAALDEGRNDPNLGSILSGARGTGKTAILNYMASVAPRHGWIAAQASAMEGMLDTLVEDASAAAEDFTDSAGRRISGLTIGPLSAQWAEPPAAQPGFKRRLSILLDALEAHGSGLLLIVDEINPSLPDMAQLGSIYQQFVGEGRKIALLMAGLPHAVSALVSGTSSSFLRRASLHRIGSVSVEEVKVAMRRTIEQAGRTIDSQALTIAAEATGGYPYLIQLIGYRMWAANADSEAMTIEDAREAVNLAAGEFERQVLDATFRDLSATDISFLVAMAAEPGASLAADIGARMGKNSSYVAQYRRRLLDQGVIEEVGKGRVAFALPGLREYVQRRVG